MAANETTLRDHLRSFLADASSSQFTLDAQEDLVKAIQQDSKAPLPHHDVDDIWFQFDQHVGAVHGEAAAGQAAIDRFGDDEMESGAYLDGTGTVPRQLQANSPAATGLDHHLSQLAAIDSQLAESVKQSITAALASSRSSDQISAELAEAIGFENLDLVSSIVSDRQTVLQALQAPTLPPASTAAAVNEPISSDAVGMGTIALPVSSNHSGMHESMPLHRGARPYIPGSQVVIHSQEERQQAKRLKNEMRKAHRSRTAAGADVDEEEQRIYTAEELERIREESLAAAASRPLYSGTATGSVDVQYPHVFSSGAQGNVLSVFGQKFALPIGTLREEREFYEEVTIPPPKTVPMRLNERFIPIAEMDPICRGAFPGYKSLNRLQSAVYPLAYRTNENLLVCAPTGAGKTDVAMLTVMRAISQYARNLEPTAGQGAAGFDIARNDFKIIYVAPMKALAAEVVRKFSKRLQYLGIKVRELTGDMQMTRQEIAETQMIVTTPEKWDVVTRKPTGEGELATKVRLLIIDEVHLLHDQRGSVIETIVARTLRLVESSQSLIRIVGLSATLPNYVDVADFLRVNRFQGLFYFDSSFRPVPLEQHFLGVKGKVGSHQSRANLDKACFEKVSELLQAGHQVMVFVHARKETVKTAQTLREMFREEAMADVIQTATDENPKKAFFKRELQSSRNREMKELFDYGFGIHHAGMLRSDRTLSERMFEAGVTRVLCCTATLAWGVNLPAYAVVIKGTDVYDSSAGKFIDLSILDVLQIFGRAGRPQYEDLGVGYILTSQDRLSHYVDAITSQHPIESKFIGGLIDSLNAEIALGTVGSVGDGVSWLGYTYLFTRMKRTPLTYGMTYDEVADDPHLGAKRQQLINVGVKKLVEAKMVVHDTTTDRLQVSDLGRIAAKYYIGYRTIEIFNERLRPNMSEADVLGLLSQATDFEQIVPRDTEEKELKKMLENAPCEVSGGIETSPGKVNILLQAYISKTYVEDFALVSDSAYVAQNAGRIVRALLEIALSYRWSRTASALISMSKAIEKRMWPFDHPLQQSNNLAPDTLYGITQWADEVEIADLAEMSSEELGKLVHLNARLGATVRQAARSFPRLTTEASLRPLSHDLLRIDVRVDRAFEWSERQLGRIHGFYVWIEDENEVDILQWMVHLTRVSDSTSSNISFTIPVPEAVPGGLTLRWMSDSWLGSEDSEWISFEHLVMPPRPPSHDALLDLPLLPVQSALQDDALLRELYSRKFAAFNAIQTQSFHALMHTSANALLSGPNACGKSTVAMMAAWRALQRDGDGQRNGQERAVVIVHARREGLSSTMQSIFAVAIKQKGIRIHRTSLSREVTSLICQDKGARVLVTTASSLLHALESRGVDLLRNVSLLVTEDLQLLNAQYELALMRVLLCSSQLDVAERPRIVATSASLHDATSLAQWLGVDEMSTYNFHPKDRPSILTTSFQAFDLPHSAGLLKTMVKPAFDKLKETRAQGPAIVVVPSRGQCYTVAGDLITKAAAEMDTDGFLGLPMEEIESILPAIQDTGMHEPLSHGIGIIHDLTIARDRSVVEHLYEQGLVKVLVISRECSWTISMRAHLTVVMSTQFVRLTKAHGSTGVSDRELVDYTLADLARMQSLAVRPGTPTMPSSPGECLVLCQTDKVTILEKMLQSGTPLHSSLLDNEEDRSGASSVLIPTVLAELVRGTISTRQQVVELLTWTILPVELSRNPTYYDCASGSADSVGERLQSAAASMVDTLQGLRLVKHATNASSAVKSSSAAVTSARKDGRDDAILQVTELGKALQLQTGSTLMHLVQWHARVSSRPSRVAREMQMFTETQKLPNAQEPVTDLSHRDVLAATLSTIPADWRTTFGLPGTRDEQNASSTAKKHGEQAKNGDTKVAAEEKKNGTEAADSDPKEKVKQDISMTLFDKRNILLCIFFAKLELITSMQADFLGMSRRAQKKLAQQQQQEKEQAQVHESETANKDVASSVTPERSPIEAIKQLELELASYVLAMLEAVTRAGGRN
ncbi:Sec63-domain-containing protein [Testicularia cyperi]|uniref:Sec63-domain-containing protein n=1 Tax=Testicularia cyperi TaxID=1882483 RepID=A0A317XY99_9BASI|nr:Sec63-domain-containing protein [Testicularia cyperi]